MDRKKDGQKDGQTLFYRTLPAETGGPKKSNNIIKLLVIIVFFRFFSRSRIVLSKISTSLCFSSLFFLKSKDSLKKIANLVPRAIIEVPKLASII